MLERFGVRVFPNLDLQACYKVMLRLLHPDKNANSPESNEATRKLLEAWPRYQDIDPGIVRGLPMNALERELASSNDHPDV